MASLEHQGERTGWIWLAREPEGDAPVIALFRTIQFLQEKPGSFPVRISADSRYKLFVNGTFCHAGPCKSDPTERCFDEVDVAPWLRLGENVWAAEVLHYSGGQSNYSVCSTPTPGLWIQSTACDLERGTPVFRTDDRWQGIWDEGRRIVSENPFFAPLQIYEVCSHLAGPGDWMARTYPCDWPYVRVYEADDLCPVLHPDNLRPRPIPRMTNEPGTFLNTKGMLPHMIPAHRETRILLDAGVLKTGYLHLTFRGGAGAQLEVLQAESFVKRIPDSMDHYEDMPVKGDRTDTGGILAGYSDHLTVGGYGTGKAPEHYEPFWVRTFRYVQLTVRTLREPLVLLGADYRTSGYPLDIRSRVETSDPGLSAVWEISARSLKLCMQETYMDCPFYEQLQYLMDARSEMLFTYAVSGDDTLARRGIELLSRGVGEDGLLNACYPSRARSEIPGFSIYFIGMLRDHMMYFGDATFLSRYLPTVSRILDFFDRSLDSRGLVGRIGGIQAPDPRWSFIDWTPEWDQTRGVPPAVRQGPLTMESLLYLLGLNDAAEICHYVGQRQQADLYALRAARLGQAIRAHCRRGDGMYADGPGSGEASQHCQVFAVLTGVCTPEEGRDLLTRTLDHTEQHAQCSTAMAFYLFRALEQCGLYERTGALWAPWRRMLADHLTTCAEDTQRQRSDCHGWGALALYELPCSVLGVRPAEPGFASIALRPMDGGLDWARGVVITPKGPVEVSWEKGADGQLNVTAKTPPGVPVKGCSPSAN